MSQLTQQLRDRVYAMTGHVEDYLPLLNLVGDAHIVLIGEASHGTQEFYAMRAELTRQLIETKGFNAVAVEADWPDAYRVNEYVRGVGEDSSPEEALRSFQRFPTWMWRNRTVEAFVTWLRHYNQRRANNTYDVGFYGLDLYSLFGSIEAVLDYLDRIDPEAARRARDRYSCFQSFAQDPQAYGYAASLGVDQSCEDEALSQFMDLQSRAAAYMNADGRVAEDAYFYAEQNARLAVNAEEYYRTMFLGSVSSWNLRDQHMADTLVALRDHLRRQQGTARIVVWAHNSHLGDARATEMGERGEFNLGQRAREFFGEDTVNIGFSTYTGTVSAADDWGGVVQRKVVRPGLVNSYELLFHEVGLPAFVAVIRGNGELARLLRGPRPQRAIGVIYRPQTERYSHYFNARLADQFDAMIHIDQTRAVEPLELSPGWPTNELPETYPSGQ